MTVADSSSLHLSLDLGERRKLVLGSGSGGIVDGRGSLRLEELGWALGGKLLGGNSRDEFGWWLRLIQTFKGRSDGGWLGRSSVEGKVLLDRRRHFEPVLGGCSRGACDSSSEVRVGRHDKLIVRRRGGQGGVDRGR